MEVKVGASSGLGERVVTTFVGHAVSKTLNNAQLSEPLVARRVTCIVMYATSGIGDGRGTVIVILD